MWYKVKYTSDEVLENGKTIHTLDYYLTDADNFAEAGYKVLQENNGAGEVEDVQLLKTYKPAINEKCSDDQKLFIIKVAEDYEQDNGTIKTLKYPSPVFARNNDELQLILKDYIAQGLDNMRVTTISETKWKYIK